MHGPFEIELKIRATDGKQTAILTYEMPVGIIPKIEDITAALASTAKVAQKQLGKKWRLQTREEFENEIINERAGTDDRWATAQKWDDPAPKDTKEGE